MSSEPRLEPTTTALPDGAATDKPAALDYFVVGVGASAGGMEAFGRLLEALPADPGMAFILVVHLDPHHESLLTTILSRSSKMPVAEAADGGAVEPNHIYIIPPNMTVALADGKLEVRVRSPGRGPHMPVDHLFRSLAHVQRGKAIGVVLSGGGSDGTLGLQEISAEEGITFAQDERSAKYDSMPRSAVASGAVDFVMPPEEIARELLRIAQHPYGERTTAAPELPTREQSDLSRVFALIRSTFGVEFAQYKQSTIKRRIYRRMALRGLQDLQDYIHYLEENANELQALYQDFLIRVTSFFRDKAAFQALQDVVFPRLMQDRSPEVPLRIWVAGCSTGEEVYSIAISLFEFLGDKATSTPIKLLATDVSESALEKARAGTYIENIELDVSPERLRRFFLKVDGYYQVSKTVRDMCIFSRHNLVRDPPYSRLDLITCRNLLIYLSLPVQKRVIPLFHYALKPGGFLVLGTSETISSPNDMFDLVDEKQKIYRRMANSAPALPLDFDLREFNTFPWGGFSGTATHEQDNTHLRPDLHREADRAIVQRYGPPGVLIDENLNVLQFRGHTGPYLEHTPGSASLSLLRMVREGLLVELRKALNQARTEKRQVRKEGLLLKTGEGFRTVHVDVLPLQAGSRGGPCFLVLFEEPHAPASPPAGTETAEAVSEPTVQRVTQMQQELDATREYLQSVIEEHESTNEELKSAHEEILSNNEELQSTNEELQSAKEEMQSANEELATVNEELRHRNEDLAKVNDDLLNLLSGVNIPIVIVGRDLRIRRVTPLAEKVFNLIPTDVGRLLTDIRSNLNLPNLSAVISEVIQTLHGREVEAQDLQGVWYLVRIRPYITQENRIDGASIVAVDIGPQKLSIKQAEELKDAASASQARDEFLAMLAHELRNPLAPLANALHLLRLQDTSLENTAILELADRQVRHLSRLLEDLLDVARVAPGKVRLQKKPIELAAPLNRAAEDVRSQAEQAHQHVELHLPAEPMGVEGDPTRLEQVFTNLLANAVKYTPPEGCITVSAAGEDSSWVVRVKDTGIGIAADMLPRVFDLFSQAEQGLDRARGGLGIGLTLVKRLVELHGGTVQAFSEGSGKGSEFVVRLPALAGPLPPAEPHHPPAEAATARRVLLVEDNPDAMDTLAALLREAGHEVRMAPDGPTALRLAGEEPPEVVLLDIGLPGLNGCEVARQLRQLPGMKGALLIALTGYGQEEDRRRSQDAGLNHHLVKPLQMEELNRLLAASKALPS